MYFLANNRQKGGEPLTSLVNLRIKRIRFRPVCIICLALFCSTGTVFAQVTDDHGNTPETASVVIGGLGTDPNPSGVIETGDDIDYFQISTNEDSVESRLIFTTGDLDTVGTLLDSNGNFLSVNDNLAINGFNFAIVGSSIAGDQYITVESAGASTGSYVLNVVTIPSFEDDHSDTIEGATEIVLDGTRSSIINTAGIINTDFEADYFKFTISTTPTSINISTTETSDKHTVGTLIDSAGNVLETQGGVGDFMIRRLLPPDTYYIRVGILGTSVPSQAAEYTESHPSRTGPYTLVVEDEPVVWFRTPRRVVTEGGEVDSIKEDIFATIPIETDRLTAEPLTVNLLYTSEGANTGVSALTGEFSLAPDVSTMITINTHIRTAQTFSVEVKDDRRAAEFTHSVNIVLQPGDGYVVSERNRSKSRYDRTELAVMDNDFAEVFFSQAGGTVTEGEPIELIVRRDLETAIVTAVNIEFTTTGNFFESMSIPTTRLSFPAGVAMSTRSIMIPTVDDFNVEADGTLQAQVVIIPGSPLRPGTPGARTVTVLDNDVPAEISFERDKYTIDEGTSATITLIADPLPSIPIQIELTIDADETTAESGRYELSTTVVVFAADQERASFNVSALDNGGTQQPEVLSLSLNPIGPSSNNAVRGMPSSTAITIQDSETVVSFIGTTNLEVIEGDASSATLYIETNRFTATPLTVDLLYTGDPDALTGDFSSATPAEISTEVSLATDITTRHTFNVAIADDQIAEEGTRTAQIVLQPGDGYFVSETASTISLSVIDNDVAEVSFLQATGTVTEGTTIVFTVVRDLETDIPTEATITFAYTNSFFEDTPIQTTRLSFPMEGTMITREIMIPTVDDLNVEADGALSAAITMTSGMLRVGTPGTSIVMILNDDVPAAISFEQDEYNIVEGTTGIITLTAEPPSGLQARIELTATSTMILNNEYQLSPTPIIVFQPGQSTTMIRLSVPDSDDREGTRDLLLSIVPLGNNTERGEVFETVVRVRDNTVPIASLEVFGDDSGILTEEMMTSATLRVTLDSSFDRDTSITIVTGGVAIVDEDYIINKKLLEFPVGSTYTETTLTVTNDDQVEPNETIVLSLDAFDPLIIDDSSSARQTLTIEDNDMPVIRFEQAGYTIVEGTTGTVALVADQPPVVETRIELTVASAMILNSDYRLSTTIVVFQPSQTTASFEVSIFDDNDLQATRELRLSFDVPDNNAIRGATSETVITIEDDDMPVISFEQAEYTIDEGTTGTVTLIASPPPIVETAVELTTLMGTTVAENRYRLSPAEIVFGVGEDMVSFEVFIVDDNGLQETQELRLSFNLPDNNAERGATSETVIRVKDSLAPIASLEAVGRGDGDILLEAEQNVMLRVTLSRTFAQSAIITIVTGGNAVMGDNDDYRIANTQLVFPSNTLSVETTLVITSTPTLDREIILSLSADNPLIIADGPESQLTLTIGKATLLFRIKVFLEGAQ